MVKMSNVLDDLREFIAVQQHKQWDLFMKSLKRGITRSPCEKLQMVSLPSTTPDETIDFIASQLTAHKIKFSVSRSKGADFSIFVNSTYKVDNVGDIYGPATNTDLLASFKHDWRRHVLGVSLGAKHKFVVHEAFYNDESWQQTIIAIRTHPLNVTFNIEEKDDTEKYVLHYTVTEELLGFLARDVPDFFALRAALPK